MTNELIYLLPGEIRIGANVRTDLAEDKDFAATIKARGVLEAVTVFKTDDGLYELVRGQRRTLTAARVAPETPIPARVTERPEEADRISDQMVENIHRAGMQTKEIVSGVEQLALIGVSAAQITKRLSVPRAQVNTALSVVGKQETRERFQTGELTLEQAAIFAEFEGDEEATETLNQRLRNGWPLTHTAQQLRDKAAARQADAAAFAEAYERLSAEGLPVLTAEEVEQAEEAGQVLRITSLITEEGESLPEEEWPNVPGARVQIVKEWIYPEPEDQQDQEDQEAAPATREVDQDDAADEDEEEEDSYVRVDPVEAYVPVWVVTDVEASGLHRRTAGHASSDSDERESAEEAEARAEAEHEAAREERRRVIANNKAWTSAEVVRREWLTTFLTRKTPPKGAEALVCEAVVFGPHFLYKAMESNHPMLRTLSGVGADKSRWDSAGELATIAAKGTGESSTPKAATMVALAAVVSAWEATLGKHTWRNPSRWDARMLTALTGWGYEPSEVESLLLPQPEPDQNEEPAGAQDEEPAGDQDDDQDDDQGVVRVDESAENSAA